MSGYWSATSGTALIIPKEEAKDFFTRYLLETYRKDGVTDRDIDFIDCTISEYGSDSFYFLRSAYRQSLLEDFHSLESCVNERNAAEHKKELFNCVEYCEEEYSGGVLYSFKEPACGSNAGLAVSRETNKIPSNLLAKREKSGSAFSTGIPLF